MTKVLITGGTGFLGYHLGRHLLERNAEVHLLDNLSRGPRDRWIEMFASRPRTRVISADLRDPSSLHPLDHDYTHVYHMAALIGVANVLERPFAVLRENVEMLSNVIDFARGLVRLERLVFPSTSEVYAGTLRYFDLPIPTPEATPLAVTALAEPRTSYMLSKIYGEALCTHSGLPYTIVRPHNVYGPRMGMQHVIPELLHRTWAASPGGTLDAFSIDHTRTFCYVDDAIELIRRLAEAEATRGETFNVGTPGPEHTIREVAELIIRIVGRPLTVQAGPTTPGSPSRRLPDMKLTVEITGYEPVVSLEAGISRTYEWYLREVFEPNVGGAVTQSVGRS